MKKILRIPFIVIDDLVLFFIANIPGRLGIKLRYFYWRLSLKKCGRNVRIETGVMIENPGCISIGDNVLIDKYSLITAGKRTKHSNDIIKEMRNTNFRHDEGELVIGNGVHIGCFNIIQAHAGVFIGDFVTTSAGVKMFSISNYYSSEQNPELITYANCMVGEEKPVSYISSPIVVEEGVWLALNCSVLCGTIGANSFIASNSVVLKDLPPNSYARGNPAVKIKERFTTEK